MTQSSIHNTLVEHLAWWGLRSFDSDDAYFQWQRETLGKEMLADLHRLVTAKQAPDAPPAAETAFYDRSADPRILPVLYSQRYHYYLSLAPLIARVLHEGPGTPQTVLDCGCGIGVLTTFWARLFPSSHFVGLDRSAASLAVALDRAKALGLANLRFEETDLDQTPVRGSYDVILATQTLLQSEQEPGLASRSWETFERARGEGAQAGFEARTRFGAKLEHLRPALAPEGRLVLFEKARQLARRVPLQRALAGRGWHLLTEPVPLRYRIVEEISDDGPLYVLGQAPADPAVAWDETPEDDEGSAQYRCCGPAAEIIHERLPERIAGREHHCRLAGETFRVEWGRAAGFLAYLYVTAGAEDGFRGMLLGPQEPGSELDCRIGRLLSSAPPEQGDDSRIRDLIHETWPAASASEDREHAPLYENHRPSAQAVWQGLPAKTLLKQQTWDDPRAGLMHVELGQAGALGYLYQANTYDQRQLVLMDRERMHLLEDYWRELVAGASQARS